MASVIATTASTHSSNSGRFLPCPSSFPSWKSPHRNYVDTVKTPLGYTTTWSTHHDIIRLSVTDSHPPNAFCIAHFPSLNALSHQQQSLSSGNRSASLVTASYRFVTIATPGEDVVRTPIGDPLMDPMSPTHLFPLPSGIILKTEYSQHPNYHFLAHPLQQPIPIHDLPAGHTLLYSFPDIPLIITRTSSSSTTSEDKATLTIWSCTPTDVPISSIPNSEHFTNNNILPSPTSNFNINSDIDKSISDTFPIPDIITPTETSIFDHQNLVTVSTIKLTSIYQTSIHSTKSISAFLSHDVHGLLVLCIVSDSILTGLSIIQPDETTFKISPSFRVRDVYSAVPILAVRCPHDCLDTLVQHLDGSLSLFMGRNRLCSVSLPSQDSMGLSLNPPLFTLSQPVTDEFSLFNAEKGEGVRFSLDKACFISPMVNDCLGAITFSFEETSSVNRITALYHDLLSARALLKRNPASFNQIYGHLLSSPNVHDIEWSLLENVLLRIIAPPSALITQDKSQNSIGMDIDSSLDLNVDFDVDEEEDEKLLNAFKNYSLEVNDDEDSDEIEDKDGDDESDSEWNALLQSEYHEEFISTKEFCPVPPRARKQPTNTSSTSLDFSFPSNIINEYSTPNFNILKQVLYALHLLYEDRKLRSLCTSFCHQLARLNYRLACVLNDFSYIDHYRRDFPDLVMDPQQQQSSNLDLNAGLINNCSNIHFSKHTDSTHVVPSIMDYLKLIICGGGHTDELISEYFHIRKDNGKLGSNQNSSLTAQWRRESPFQLTQRIINYYTILFSDKKSEAENDGQDDDDRMEDEPKNEVTNIPKSKGKYEQVLLAMVKDNVVNAEIDALPFGIALPLRDVLWKCRQQPNPNWPLAAFALIGREDLFNVVDYESESPNNPKSTGDDSLRLVRESRALLQIHAAAAAFTTSTSMNENGVNGSSSSMDNNNDDGNNNSNESDESKSSFVEEKGDGCELEASIFKLRFAQDRRLNEVRRLLRSTDLVVMNAVQQQQQQQHDGQEFDMIAEQKLKLAILLRKRFASPIGRGAYTLRTYIPTDPTKPLPVPKINMSGIIIGQNAKVTFLPSDTSFMQWGEFHNGVAAGLRIVASNNCNNNAYNNSSQRSFKFSNGNDNNNNYGDSNGNYTEEILTRSWIVNHKPSDITSGSTHAGMLLALGLGGYLPVLRKTDYIQYLVPRHELTAIGLMLGLSAGNIGCADEKITKMLCLHIRPFNEAGFSVPEFQVSVNVQTSAILGLGLLHLGSCEYSLLEGLFTELGRRPKPGDSIDNREGLSLSIGFAIGLICLGHGNSAFDVENSKKKIDTLILYANGGSIHELLLSNNKNGGNTNQNNLNEVGNKEWLIYDEIINSNTNDNRKLMMNIDLNYSSIISNSQDHRTNSSINATATAVAESETSRVMEGLFVNNDVTSPGALLALGLMFMKTNDKKIAERIILPDSLYSLARVRSDHVYLRLLIRCIIMWDDIDIDEKWICKVIPNLLLPINHDNTYNLFDLQGKVNINEIIYQQQDIDVSGILQARAYAITAACTAIALKYAGTNDNKGKLLVMKLCEAFEKALISLDLYGTSPTTTSSSSSSTSMEFVYGTGLCSTALALSIICAGSGDLEVLKLFRRLRKRGSPKTPMTTQPNYPQNAQQPKYQHSTTLGIGKYGLNMAIHMAIGFLFLGGGCQTFGTSNLGIVGLLCSIHIPFPRDINDNQYHLQAFRHLYVLAVEPRCIETRDIDTGKWCSVDMEVEMKTNHGGNIIKIQAPCIIPECNRIKEIRVISERYLTTKINLNTPLQGTGWYSNCRSQIIFVKRKVGHLPYNIDPKGSKGILSRILNRPKPNFDDGNDGNDEENDEKYFKQVDHLVKAFSADPEILAFVKYFCNVNNAQSNYDEDSDESESESESEDEAESSKVISNKKKMNQKNGEREKRYVEMLYECLSKDKADGIKVYIELEGAVERVLQGKASGCTIDSLMLCEAYMLLSRKKANSNEEDQDEDRLIRTDFIAEIVRKVRRKIQTNEDVRKATIRYFSSQGQIWPGLLPSTSTTNNHSRKRVSHDEQLEEDEDMKISRISQDLANGLRLNSVPPISGLGDIAEWIEKASVDTNPNSIDDAWVNIVGNEKLTRLNDTALEFLIDLVEKSMC